MKGFFLNRFQLELFPLSGVFLLGLYVCVFFYIYCFFFMVCGFFLERGGGVVFGGKTHNAKKLRNPAVNEERDIFVFSIILCANFVGVPSGSFRRALAIERN